MGIVTENMCTKFDANTSISRQFKSGESLGGISHPGGERGGIAKKWKKCHVDIVPENMCTKFDANTSIFRLFKAYQDR